MNPENKPPKRTSLGKVFAWIAVSFLAFIILLIMIIPDVPETAKIEKKAKAESVVIAKEEKPVKKPSIVPSLDAFKERYSENIEGTTLNPEIDFKVKKETPNKFSTSLSEYVVVIGDLNDDGSIHSFVILSGSDGSMSKIAEQLSALAALISVVNPEFAPEDRGRILRHLGFFDEDADITTMDSSYTENGITYKAFYYSVDNVLQFIISPEKPKK